MAVRSVRRRKPRLWTPPIYSAKHGLTITRDNGTVDDLSAIAHRIEVEDGVTDTIGRFEFELWNPNETYTNLWDGMEVVRFYCDYSDTATTLRFRGRVEKVSYQDNKIKVSGRSEALVFMDKTVTKSFDDKECSFILKSIVDSYGDSAFTYSNVAASTVDLTVNWFQKPFWDCIKELCNAAGFDCYIDSALDFHFFEASSVTNTDEAMVHTSNLLEVKEFADDITFVRNKIIVYGAEQDGIQLLYTAEDGPASDSTTSQGKYGVREEIVNDSNIIEYTQAQEYGDYLLAQKKDPPQVGEVKGMLLASIQPGEQIRLSSPLNNIPPGNYDILSFKQTIDFSRGLFTTLKVNKEPRTFSHVISKMIEQTNQQKQTNLNPFELNYSYNFLFDDDSGTHSNTEITDGVLKPTAVSGTWISLSRDLDDNITEAYLIAIGETLTGATFYVSGDAGTHWQTIADKGQLDVTSATGKKLKVKVIFDDTDTQIDSLSLLYKTE